jgi:hypothetical protein
MAVFVCTCFSANLYAGWFDSNNAITVPENKVPNPNAPAVKYAATIRATKYVDGRTGLPAKNIGIATEQISGISGSDLLLDREVAELVTSAIKKRFDDAGFQLVEDSSALYELSGVVKELTYNVKARDEISISIETTLKEIATGKIVWSGVVAEKDNRFAGISGNSKSDIANYLRNKLGIVTKKTYAAISDSLMASHPELFNLAPGTKPIAGVTVLFASGANQPASSVTPAVSVMTPAKTTGILVLRTKPARAKVYLEDVYFGMSPLRVEVEAKVHNVSVKLDGHKTTTEKVSVRKDETTELELVLER